MESSALFLVIDDDPDLLEGMARILRRDGHRVVTASTGAEGVRLAEEQQPDMAVVDMMLPDMNCVEVCKQIQAGTQSGNIDTILISSTRIAAEDKVEGFHVGVCEYIARPVANKEFLARVNARLKDKQTRDSLKLDRNKARKISDDEKYQRNSLEKEKDVQLQLFRLVNEASSLETMAEDVLSFFKTWSKVDAVAIRLRQGGDFPYYKTLGFPKEFIRRENSLHNFDYSDRQPLQPRAEADLECMCGCVINGLPDSSLPFFTAGGSFCTNSTTRLLSQSEGFKMPSHLRKHCNEAGYESVLLVRLKVGDNSLGLIQFNHKEKNRFTPEFVSLMEGLAGYISLAVVQRLTEKELRTKQNELMEMNAALKVLIRSREDDLLEHDRGVLINIRQLILPCVERMKLGSLDTQQISQLNILESNLETITSPFAKKLSSTNTALTPSLIQVADMIKKGITNKEMARLLGISVKSVETYRKRIRERLNLRNSKINLRSYLINIE